MGSPAGRIREISAAVDQGIACMATLCDAVGSSVELMVDCHSFFDVPLARSVAERLERYKLGWYEEPVAPERTGRHSGNPEVDPATDGWRRFCSASADSRRSAAGTRWT